MALKKSVNTDFGISVADAYHRVKNINLFEKDRMIFSLEISAVKSLPPFSHQQHECALLLDGENPLSQAYAHLKTLPQFADAVDC